MDKKDLFAAQLRQSSQKAQDRAFNVAKEYLLTKSKAGRLSVPLKAIVARICETLQARLSVDYFEVDMDLLTERLVKSGFEISVDNDEEGRVVSWMK